MKKTDLDRRDFLKTATGVCGLVALGTTLAACDSNTPEGGGVSINGNKIQIDLSIKTNLQQSGGFLLIQEARTFVLNEGGTFKAFTSICTHQQCDVNNFESNAIICPCHGSRFNTSGAVAVGPATSPLTSYSVSQNGDLLTITKS